MYQFCTRGATEVFNTNLLAPAPKPIYEVLLMTRPKYPLSRGRCSNTSFVLCFCDIADYRCYTPTSSVKMAYRRDRPWRGAIAEKLASEARSATRGRRMK